jgi:hypothetical protein
MPTTEQRIITWFWISISAGTLLQTSKVAYLTAQKDLKKLKEYNFRRKEIILS